MKLFPKDILLLNEKLFQNVYGTLSQLEGIFFLKRGEAVEENVEMADIDSILA